MIGLTGGIGSGKSEVGRRFAALGIPVIDTDEIARELVRPGSAALAEIASAFGAEILTADGELDRRRLRDLVFANDTQRRRLEDILHPRIREHVGETVARLTAPYVVVVIPLLMETRYPIPVDRVLVVDAPEELQVRRVMTRDQVDETDARRIVARQISREQRLASADDVIDNTGELDALDLQVAELHRRYFAAARPQG